MNAPEVFRCEEFARSHFIGDTINLNIFHHPFGVVWTGWNATINQFIVISVKFEGYFVASTTDTRALLEEEIDLHENRLYA